MLPKSCDKKANEVRTETAELHRSQSEPASNDSCEPFATRRRSESDRNRDSTLDDDAPNKVQIASRKASCKMFCFIILVHWRIEAGWAGDDRDAAPLSPISYIFMQSKILPNESFLPISNLTSGKYWIRHCSMGCQTAELFASLFILFQSVRISANNFKVPKN